MNATMMRIKSEANNGSKNTDGDWMGMPPPPPPDNPQLRQASASTTTTGSTFTSTSTSTSTAAMTMMNSMLPPPRRMTPPVPPVPPFRPPPASSAAAAASVLNSNNSVDNKRPALLHNQNRTDEGNDRKRIRLDNNYSGSNQDTKPTPPDPTTISTHIVFVIDFSGSMRTKDVATKNGTKITRWDAVFECIDGFLEDQINSGRDEENAIVIDGDENYNYKGSAATTTVSVVIFNDKGQALLRHVPLVGDGRKVRSQLESARKNHSPRGGTGFSAGFQLAKQLGTQDASGRALTPKKTKRQNTVVVFLSDGRPGDLSHHPPKKASLPMQTTFRRKKKTHVAAGEHIQQMKRTLGDRFALHFICIHKDGKSWLKYLAERYNGNFHEPSLDVNDDSYSADLPDASIFDDSDDDDDEEEVLEMNVKSQDTLLRDKYNRALVAGQVFSVHNTTTAAAGSSMRSTFRTISSSVTAMRGGGGSSRLQERQGVVFKETSPMIAYDATRMVLDKTKTSFTVPPGETPNGRNVTVSLHPFAQGGLRNVYRMTQAGSKKGQRQVAKESRHEVGYSERLRFHIETSKCQARAETYANKFNGQRGFFQERKANGTPRIKMLRAEVVRLRDARAKGGFRYLAVESELEGTYQKWNSNNGYVNPSQCVPCKVAQAFSHFSYERSKQTEMVVDIQGDEYAYTDPQLHSLKREFGRADRGLFGIKDFFRTHGCNSICRALELPDRSMEFASAAAVKFESVV